MDAEAKWKRKKKMDPLLLLWRLVMASAIVGTLLAPTVAIISGVDPLGIMMRALNPSGHNMDFKAQICFFLLRQVIYSIAVFEGFRMGVTLFAVGVIAMRLCQEILQNMDRLKLPQSFFRYYRQFNVIYLTVFDVTQLVISSYFVVSFPLVIGSNYAAIKLHTVLPMLMYFYAVIFAIGMPLLMNATLPVIVSVYDQTKEMLRTRLILYSDRRGMKYLIRSLKSMQPIALIPGTGNIFNIIDVTFGKLKRSTVANIFWYYIDYTITCLLCIDPHSIQMF